jgi:hypothetical protein
MLTCMLRFFTCRAVLSAIARKGEGGSADEGGPFCVPDDKLGILHLHRSSAEIISAFGFASNSRDTTLL